MKYIKKHIFLYGLALVCTICMIFAGCFLFENKTQPVFAATTYATNYEMPEWANEVFTDYTCTELTDDYKSSQAIDALRAKQTNTANAEKYIKRAEEVLAGQNRYTELREFSSEKEGNNKIEQVGDLEKYSSQLKIRFSLSDLIITGIYGMAGDEIRVFVETSGNYLPQIVITQNHGYWMYDQWRKNVILQKGMNVFSYSDFVTGSSVMSQSEIAGGAIYLLNPYEAEEQGEVKVYIEGGGFYPVFRKGDDEERFLGMLKEYETERLKNTSTMLNMAELVTDNLFFTTTSSSLYDNYIKTSSVSPTENLELWGEFAKKMFEFNGIALSPSSVNENYKKINNYLRINFRYMTVYQGSGAYTYNYHIGFYNEHDWFANFYKTKNIFNMCHEIGHILDTKGRQIDETTNNMAATYGYIMILHQAYNGTLQPFEKSFNNLSNDFTLNGDAFKDGNILYDKGSGNGPKDRNYMIWWFLESVFPDYWAKLNSLYRTRTSEFNTTTELNERMVYYSSLVTGVDLTNYFERWGFYYDINKKFEYSTASQNFKTLMAKAKQENKIKDAYDHFWLVDSAEYDFIRNNLNATESEKQYTDTPQIVAITKNAEKKNQLTIKNNKSTSHLGYEIYVSNGDENFKIAGFTTTNTFVDNNAYNFTPTYKVRAVNRFFQVTDYSNPKSDIGESSTNYVCKLNGVNYTDLGTAIEKADKNETIHLLDDCVLTKTISRSRGFILEVDESVDKDVHITHTVNNNILFLLQIDDGWGDFKIIGKDQAKIIFDGGSTNRPHALIEGRGNVALENVVFQNFDCSSYASVIHGGNKLTLTATNCEFNNCSSGKYAGAIYTEKAAIFINCTFKNNKMTNSAVADGIYIKGQLTLENCIFSGQTIDVYLDGDLTLKNQQNEFSLNLNDIDGDKQIFVESGDIANLLSLIKLKNNSMMLTEEGGQLKIKNKQFKLSFNFNGNKIEHIVEGNNFIFGDENQYTLGNNQYLCYTLKNDGQKFYQNDTLVLSQDMEFDVEIKNKNKLTLQLKNGNNVKEEIVYLMENEKFYLPQEDDGQKIVQYKGEQKTYYAGEAFIANSNKILLAVYENILNYSIIVKENVERHYGQSGDVVTLPKDNDIIGWNIFGKFYSVGETVKLETDCDIVAIFEGEELLDLSNATIEIDKNFDLTYDGKEKCPNFTVKIDGQILDKSKFNFEYIANTNVGSATIRIYAKTGFSTGEKTYTFIITAKELDESELSISGLEENFVYDGQQKHVNLQIQWQRKLLNSGTDYDISYSGNHTNAGTFDVTITFKGNFSGTITKQFEIQKANQNATLSIQNWTYAEQEEQPEVIGLAENASVIYAYSTTSEKLGNYVSEKPKNAGSYWVKAEVSATQNYNPTTLYTQFTIAKANGNVTVQMSDWTYGENAQSPSITTTTNQGATKTIEYAKENSLDFSQTKPTNAGGYVLKVTLASTTNYKACSNTATFEIFAKDISGLDITIEDKDLIYSGSALVPNIIIKHNQKTLIKNTDYGVEFSNNTNAGKKSATATIQGKGNYTGQIIKNFSIAKAERPDVNIKIHVSGQFDSLDHIPLPNGFEWDKSTEIEHISDTLIRAKANYVGNDAENYEITEIWFEIMVQTEKSNFMWLIILVPFAIIVIASVGFAVARRKRKRFLKY